MVARVFKTRRIDDTEPMKPIDYEQTKFPIYLMSRRNFFPSLVSFSITSPLIIIASSQLGKSTVKSIVLLKLIDNWVFSDGKHELSIKS